MKTTKIMLCWVMLLCTMMMYAQDSREIGPKVSGQKQGFMDLENQNIYVTAVQDANGLWGFVDMKGVQIISPKYQEIGTPSQYEAIVSLTNQVTCGIIPVKLNDKWGFVDHNGKEVIKPAYDWVGQFTTGRKQTELNNGDPEGNCLVAVGERAFTINHKGKEIKNGKSYYGIKVTNDAKGSYLSVTENGQLKLIGINHRYISAAEKAEIAAAEKAEAERKEAERLNAERSFIGMVDGRLKYKGVFYILNEEKLEATVAPYSTTDYWDDARYKGTITVDSVLNYNDKQYTVTAIGKDAFKDCRSVLVNLPNTIKRIEDEAFYGTSYTRVKIPDNVEYLGYHAYGYCESLVEAYMPKALASTGTHVFGGSDNLQRVVFDSDKGVQKLGKYITELTRGAYQAKVYVGDNVVNTIKEAKIPMEVRKEYGAFYWVPNAQGKYQLVNKDDKVIIPPGKYDVVSFEVPAIIVKKGGKFGAVTYQGVQIVAPVYNSCDGFGIEGRILFSNNTDTGSALYVYSNTGKLLASNSFNRSQQYSMAAWMRDWLNLVVTPDFRWFNFD